MKKMITAVLLVVTLSGWTQTKVERKLSDLIGTWRNRAGNGLDIVDSNTVYIVHGHQRKLATATLSDVSKTPMSFDLTIRDSSKATTVKGMLFMMGDDNLQWQVLDSETKPVSYSYRKSDMLFMKRINSLLN